MIQKTYFFNKDEQVGKNIITAVHIGYGEILGLEPGFVETKLTEEPANGLKTIHRAPDLKLACDLYKKTVEMVDEAFAVYTMLCEQRNTLRTCIISELCARKEFDTEAIYMEGLLIKHSDDGAIIEVIKTVKP